MKAILCSFVVGVLIGGVAIYLFLNQYSVPRTSMKVTASHPQTKITDESLEVKTTYKTVKAVALFTADKKGTFTNEITINRQDLQYKHAIYGEVSYLIVSQMPLLDIAYSYENLIISAKVAYSFRLKELDYGFGIGGKLSF